MAANWTDFIRDPRKASKQLHTSKRDVQRGELMDSMRVREALRRSMRPETPAPHSPVLSPQELAALRLYEQRRRAEPPRAEGALGIIRQQLPQFFRDNQQLADTVGDLSLKEGVLGTAGAVLGGALPVAIGSGLTGAATGAGMSIAGDALMDEAARKILGESIQDPLSSGVFGALAGGTGKIIKPLIAAMGASSGDAEASNLLRLFRGVPRVAATNAEHISGLKMLERPKSSASGISDRNTRGAIWTSTSPKVASSYSQAGGVVIPLELTTPPDAVLDAGGQHWRDFFYPGAKRVEDFKQIQNSEFKDLLEDEMVSTIGVKNVIDPGPAADFSVDDFSDFMADNYLIKDPDVLRYLLTREKTKFAGGGAIKRLGKRAMSQFDELRGSSVAPQGALSVVKPKGGNWLNNSVEGALSGLKKDIPEWLREGVNPGMPTRDMSKEDALNTWIEGPLTKYVKTRMASPDDEVRRLAEQGVLHVDPAQLHAPIGLHSGVTRQEFGQSPVAKRWEFASDSFIAPETAGLFKVTRGQDGTTTLSRNPWLADLPNEATVYDLGARAHPDNLGFSHLIDELSNALNPNSGLPPHLQLSPEAVKQMSMEKAVRRVADINAHRAAQQAAANAELANKAMVVREYAENNPKGLRWVELRQNLPEKPTGDITDEKLLPWEEAKRQSAQELERQLKYEGDTMGHCVGGYCPDVLEGRSRIFSLRDAKGEPHVTVEVGKKGSYDEDGFHDFAEANGFDLDVDGVGELAMKAYNKSLEKTQPRIIQIKGKQNRKPNDEYLPFVQDFVRNSPLGGSWGDVGDLGNTGLSKISGSSYIPYTQKSLPEGFYNDAELKAAAKEAGLDDDQITNWLFNIEKNRRPYAQGGTVRQPIRPGDETMTTGTRGFTALPGQFQGIIAAIEQELANATA